MKDAFIDFFLISAILALAVSVGALTYHLRPLQVDCANVAEGEP